jgi:radical SAM protein with 4Fe4S-binding SPASM domain
LTNAFDVSLDGIEHQHNWQRKDADDNPVANPYKKTFFNIMRLVKLGLAEKIKVQAAVQDQVLNEEDKIKFFENLISVGVLLKNITYGGVHPTKKNPKLDDTYVNSLRSKTFWRVPCCDYRYMSHFSINPDGSFDDDYFQNVQRNIVRNISDFGKCYEISDLELSYREKIEKNMSVMNDRICLEKCPVLAYCWGRCHNNGYTLSNPSAHCDMKGLEEEVVKLHARDDK